MTSTLLFLACLACVSAQVWKGSVPEGSLVVNADGSYGLWLKTASGTEEPWLQSGPVQVHVDGAWYSSNSTVSGGLSLELQGAGPTLENGWAIQYLAGSLPVVASFSIPANGTSGSPFLFSLTFPQGAQGLNLTFPVNGSAVGIYDAESLREFSSSNASSTQFPVFLGAEGSNASATLGFLTWNQRFFQPASQANGGAAAAFEASAIGAEGGPIVLFDGSSAAGPVRRGVVLSIWDHFKSTQISGAHGIDGAAAVGLNGYVTSIPPNFTISAGIVLGDRGINDVVHSWGAAIRAANNAPQRMPDPVSTTLSYWTDNGAYYDFYAYEPDINSKGLVEDILAAVADTFSNSTYPGPSIPAKLLMLDAYWMYNIRPNGNCKVNDSTWPLPFPSGLHSLAQRTGMDLIIYNGPQCANSTLGADWPMMYSLYWDQSWGNGAFSAISDASAFAYYSQLFANLKSSASMAAFTQDFLDFQSLLFPDWITNPFGNALWMEAQAAAAFAAGLPLQYCMGLPADMLQSIKEAAVTNARASNDYGAGGSNWKIGGSSLLLSALDLRASKDNFWTSSASTDRGRESSPYLQGIVTALSNGPVGFADELFGTDTRVLWPTCTLNGTLLHPSRPATAVDAQFLGASSGLPLAAGDVRAAHSLIINSTSGLGQAYYSVLAVGISTPLPVALASTDLWPAPVPNATYYVWAFNNSACEDAGSPLSACAAALGSGQAPTSSPPTPTDAEKWQLVTVSPVLSNGWVVLGETSKYVSVSPDRFKAIAPVSGGIAVSLAGAPSEVVSVSYAGPAGMIKVAQLTLGPDGRMQATLQ